MIDARTYALLQDIVRRESRSLLQYVRDSFPWTTPEERDALAELQKMIEEERRGAGAIVRLLSRHRLMPPYLGAYPSDFTTSNYVSLDHLLPQLVEGQRRAIADLERDLSSLGDEEACSLVQQILETKRRHLKSLEQLAARARPEATVG